MPLQAIIPPWLRPQNPVEDYMGGVRTGVQIGEAQRSAAARQQQIQAQMAMAQQRLQQQQQLSEMELQANQKIAEERARREQQKIMIDAAYDKERLQLEQDRVAEAAKQTELKTQIAARKYEAQQGFQNAISSGMDPAQAIMQFGMGAGVPMTGMAEALRQMRPKAEVPEATLAEFGGAKFLKIPGPKGDVKYQQIKEAGDQMTKRDSAKLGVLKSELKSIEAHPLWAVGTISGGKMRDKKAQDTFDSLLKRHKDIQDEINSIVSPGGPAPASIPSAAAAPGGAPHPEGTYLRKKGGGIYVVKNGVPVALGPGEEPTEESDTVEEEE